MLKIALTAAALALGLSGAASATTIFSDSFNSELPNVPASSLTNWSIASGSVDVIGSGTAFAWCGSGFRCLDMNGNNPGRIETSLSGLTVGKKYFLSFDYGNNRNSQSSTIPEILSFGLGATGYTLDIFAQSSLTASAIYEFVAGSVTETLYFADTGTTPGDRGGPLLDNVTVSAVPLPAGGLLLMGVLGGLAALRRRKSA